MSRGMVNLRPFGRDDGRLTFPNHQMDMDAKILLAVYFGDGADRTRGVDFRHAINHARSRPEIAPRVSQMAVQKSDLAGT